MRGESLSHLSYRAAEPNVSLGLGDDLCGLEKHCHARLITLQTRHVPILKGRLIHGFLKALFTDRSHAKSPRRAT